MANSISSWRIIWRTRWVFSGLVPLLLVPLLSLVLTSSAAQNFDPGLDDKSYLNNIEKEIEDEVNRSRNTFYKQAQLLDSVARQFVAAQLKENLFIALRVLAEKELAEAKGKGVSSTTTTTPDSSIVTSSTTPQFNRTKRQDDGDEDGDDGDAGGGAAAGAAGNLLRPTIPPQIGLLPQVANLVRVIFGGNGQVNLTSYVSSVSKLLPRPVGNQVLGLVKILTNANGNPNRISFTTANPLLQGVPGLQGLPGGAGGPFNGQPLPPNLNIKSPEFAGIPPEQIAALGLDNPNSQLNGLVGLTPETLNMLALSGAIPGLTGIQPLPPLGPNGLPILGTNGLPPPAQIGNNHGLQGQGTGGAGGGGGLGGGAAGAGGGGGAAAVIPPGLTASDIAALAALGITGLPSIDSVTPAPLRTARPRSTRKPRPQYSPPNKLPPPNNNNNNNNNNQLQQPPKLLPQQTLEQPQLLIPTPPTQSAAAYPPRPINNQNPQFASSVDKDILPLNLNPNKQTLTEIQQHLQAQQGGPKYQETPLSPDWQEPNFLGPSQGQFNPYGNNLGGGGGGGKPGGGSLGGSSPSKHQGAYNKPPPQQSVPSGAYGQQQQTHQSHQNQQLQQQQPPQFLPEHLVNQLNSASGTAAAGSPSQQAINAQPGGGLAGVKPQQNRKPQHQVQQQQAILQAEQLHLLHLQQQHQEAQNPNKDKPQHQIGDTSQQQQQQQHFQPQQLQLSQHQLEQLQSLSQNQQFQQQQQANLNQNNPQFQQQQQQQQSEFQQQFQQLYLQQQQQQQGQRQQQQQQRPSPPVDEEDSEEADAENETDEDRAKRRSAADGRQLNLLQNIFPNLLGGNNRNNNNNNNNNAQPQQQNVNPPPTGVTDAPGAQGNGTMSGTATNMGFDLNMFATNLSRGIGDVVRVMPDLFRGAREGLQLIQALGTILRGFPGLADALPI